MVRNAIINVAILLLLMQGGVFAQSDVNIEFYGTIQSANNTAIVINGQIVDIRGALVNTPLTTGVGVRVQATVLSGGNLTARQVDPFPAGVIPGIVEINGTVTNFVQPILTISGQTIDTTGAEIIGTITLGQIVRVFAVAPAPGEWQARLVDAVDNMPTPITTPEVDTGSIVPPVTTPEVLPPVSTPEVGDDDNNDDENDDDDGDSDDESDDD